MSVTGSHRSFPRRRDAGFSLPELLVAMSIVIVLTVVVIANYRTASRGTTLARAAHLVATDIREAQNLALAAALIPNAAGTGPPTVPVGGYGLFFDENAPAQYVLFVDRDGNAQYDPPPSGCPGTSECYDVRQLESGIVIEEVEYGSAGSTSDATTLTILFCSPFAAALLFSDNGVGSSRNCLGDPSALQESVTVRLLHEAMASAPQQVIRNVRVWATGAIDIVSDEFYP